MEHPTCIRSLDVRVAGVAGGSLVRWSGRKITDVGPRSAHIAGLPYSCFASPEELENGQIITFKPKEGDSIDYVAIESAGGKRFAITNTCAANALGLVPEGDYAKANQISAKLALSIFANRLGITMEQAATTILDISAKKVLDIIEHVIKEYKLKKRACGAHRWRWRGISASALYCTQATAAVQDCRACRSDLIHRCWSGNDS